jgi:mRNA-degrading endonuclease RelE of RelBE toxin-antitoxin system
LSRPEKKVVIHGPPDLQEYLDTPGDEGLKARIREMFQVLSANPAAGEHVKKKLWPEKYTKQRINNLFRYRIGDQTRFAYTIVDPNAATRIVKILDFFKTHKEYERVFAYD